MAGGLVLGCWASRSCSMSQGWWPVDDMPEDLCGAFEMVKSASHPKTLGGVDMPDGRKLDF